MIDGWPSCPDCEQPLYSKPTQYVCVECGQRWTNLDDWTDINTSRTSAGDDE